MNQLLEKYQNSDIVCFATPVYTWNMTEAMKNFVDRLVPMKSPILMNQNGNFDLEDTLPKMQQFMVISSSAFPGHHNFETMQQVFKSCQPTLEIYRNCGKLLKSKDEKYEEIISDYLDTVKVAGYEWVTQNSISPQTKINLEKDFVTQEDYIKFLGM